MNSDWYTSGMRFPEQWAEKEAAEKERIKVRNRKLAEAFGITIENGVVRMRKTAASAHLMRALSAAIRKGLAVSPKSTETLVKKTYSSAERQAKHWNPNLVNQDSPDWQAARKLTGRSDVDVGRNWSKTEEHKGKMKDVISDLTDKEDSAPNIPPISLIDSILKAQKDLRDRGRDIGQMKGSIAPAKGKVEPRFDEMNTMHGDPITQTPGFDLKTVDLSESTWPLYEPWNPIDPSAQTPTPSWSKLHPPKK